MPDEVQQTFGFALYHAQIGLLHPAAKPLYVLHCFQKKSKHGNRTPTRDMDLIHERLKEAEAQAKGFRP